MSKANEYFENISPKEQHLFAMRHSAEHVLTMAMRKFFPQMKMAMGPATNEGFYFDVDLGDQKITEDDFPKIEKEMYRIINKKLPIVKDDPIVPEIRHYFSNNPYKQEWLDAIEQKGEKIIVYTIGKSTEDEFIDICSGPHVADTGEIGIIKLLSVAGAYWHGDEKNKMLTRIYGTAFTTKDELAQHLQHLEEAKKRDHRLLGEELDLFMIDEEVGQGLPMWLPKGAYVRNKAQEFAYNTYLERGYQPVVTPHIGSEKLWSHSGHLGFYKENMYSSFGIEEEHYRLKPMNCPMHIKIYQHKPRSYRDLPVRYTEMGTVYRYERSGVLHGLTRVRGFTQDDAHIICSPDQIHTELVAALKLTLYILNTFGFKDFEMNVSVRDPKEKDKFVGSDQDWEMAEKELINALAEIGYKDFIYDVGGAVFYGPKIDIKVADSIGRMWQLSTIQFDFNLPGRFSMNYIDSDGNEKVPYMIHRALLGSLERFMGVYIEHTGGAFPIWLSPVQVSIVPISDKFDEYAQEIMDKLKAQNIRVEIDNRSESMQKRIREAEKQKVPYMLVVGEREKQDGAVAVRQRGRKDLGAMKTEAFIERITKEIKDKTIW